jgi:hypothetical protein
VPPVTSLTEDIAMKKMKNTNVAGLPVGTIPMSDLNLTFTEFEKKYKGITTTVIAVVLKTQLSDVDQLEEAEAYRSCDSPL